jgi:hypothetical protein
MLEMRVFVDISPCRLTAAGWVSSSKGTPLAVTHPTAVEGTPFRTQPMTPRRFPPPWRVVEMAGFIVQDATGLYVMVLFPG